MSRYPLLTSHENVSLNADIKFGDLGDCPEPGGVFFSTRTQYSGPYSEGAIVTYYCLFGGDAENIKCGRNGYWTRKPTCPGQIFALCPVPQHCTQHQCIEKK